MPSAPLPSPTVADVDAKPRVQRGHRDRRQVEERAMVVRRRAGELDAHPGRVVARVARDHPARGRRGGEALRHDGAAAQVGGREETGIFGGLIFLDKRENSFTVPVNRSASILAGVIASFSLAAWVGGRPPSPYEFVGAALEIAAILFLSIPPMLEKKRARAAAMAAEQRAA
jgi:hypothetical protein